VECCLSRSRSGRPCCRSMKGCLDGMPACVVVPQAAPCIAYYSCTRTACALLCLCCAPNCSLLQVQMQGDVRAVVSGRQQQRRFSSISSVAAALVQQLGWRGLWQGGLPAVQRAALVNLGELTYDSVGSLPITRPEAHSLAVPFKSLHAACCPRLCSCLHRLGS
jgi:hypothetical protein